MKVLPAPVAIWIRARGRSSLKDSSRLSMAVIWQSRRPAVARAAGCVCSRARKRCRFGQPFLERFRAVEIEDFARARLGIAAIGEAGDDAGALVEEGQRLLVVDPLELGGGIAGGLLFDRRDLVAPVLWLGFDDADRLLVHEQHIVGRADVGLVFAHGDARTGVEIDLLCPERPSPPASAARRCCRGLFVRGFGFRSLLKPSEQHKGNP